MSASSRREHVPAVPLSAERVADALLENLGGFDAGWAMWRAAMARLRIAIERAEDAEFAFTSHPQGPWRKLLYGLEEGLRMAAAAAELEELRHGEGDELRNAPERRRDVASVLHERAVAVARERAARAV